MRKMKIYIVTYKRHDVLNQLVENLYNSDFSELGNTEFNIINNHTNFLLMEKNKTRVNVLHNMCRPDWSGANLGENWNQALIHGFKSLRNPDAEHVVTLQNDCVLDPNWCSNLMKMHEKYNFVAGEFGDNIVSYTPESVRNIGLWDENFVGGGHREADYYLRALYFNKKKSLINDTMHGRVWNPNDDYLTLDIPENRNIKEEDGKMKRRPDNKEHEDISIGMRGMVMNKYNVRYFFHKWGGTHTVEPTKNKWIKNWPDELRNDPPKVKPGTVYMKYPYFEKDIKNLRDKGYWVPDDFAQPHWDQWEAKTKHSNPDTYR